MERLRRFFAMTLGFLFGEEMLQVGPRHGIIGTDLHRLFKMLAGLFVEPAQRQQNPQVPMGLTDSRVNLQGIAKRRFGR